MTKPMPRPQYVEGSEASARAVAASIGLRHFVRINPNTPLARSLSDPRGSVTDLCGVYLQFRESADLYIGQTNNLTRRMQQHREAGVRVRFLAFLPCPARRLAATEAELIERALRLGHPLINKDRMERRVLPCSSAVLDDLLDAEAQDAFVEETGRPESAFHGLAVRERWRAAWDAASPAERHDWNALLENPSAGRLLALARKILLIAVPILPARDPAARAAGRAGARTALDDLEGAWWTVSIASHSHTTPTPLLTVQTGSRALLEIFRFRGAPRAAWARLALSGAAPLDAKAAAALRAARDELGWASWDVPDEARWIEGRKGAEGAERAAAPQAPADPDWCPVRGRRYPSPEARRRDLARQVTRTALAPPIRVTAGLSEMSALLDEPALREAAAAFALASMRQQPVNRPEFHSALAAFVLREPDGLCVLRDAIDSHAIDPFEDI